MSFLNNLKHGFQKFEHGLTHVVKAVGKDISGLGHVVGGVLTMNPHEISKGVKRMGEGLKESVQGIGEMAAGSLEVTLDLSPMGMAVNQLTNGGVNKLVDGAAKFATSMVTDTLEAPEHIVHGLVHGDLKEAGMGALNLGAAALMVVPGAGEAAMAAKIALKSGGEAALKAGSSFATRASSTFAGEGAGAGAKAAGAEGAGAKAAGAKAAGAEGAGAKAAAAEAAAAEVADFEVLNGYAAKYGLTPLEANASPAEVKALYKKLSLKMHPDKGGNPAEFQKMSLANENIQARAPSAYTGPGMTAQEKADAAEAAAAEAAAYGS